MNEAELQDAVRHFWKMRKKGTQSASHDKRFLDLIQEDIIAMGWNKDEMKRGTNALIAGHFRGAKSWDLIGYKEGEPVFAIEYKSQVGSYGKNENNRYEEALGSALDARARFKDKIRLGFVYVICEEGDSMKPVKLRNVPNADEEFIGKNHIERRQIFLERILEYKLNGKPLYDAASILMVKKDGGYRHAKADGARLTNFAKNLLRGLK